MTESTRPRPNAWRSRPGKASRTLIAERLTAVERYTVLDGISMAIRGERARRGLDQRAYAALVGLSKSQLARLERDPGSIRLTQVLAVLEGTSHRLGVHVRGAGGADSADEDAAEEDEAAHDAAEQDQADEREPGGDGSAEGAGTLGGPPLTGDDWPLEELMARTSAGARFPAHRAVRRVGYGGPAWYRRNYQCWISPPEGPDWTAEGHPVRSGG